MTFGEGFNVGPNSAAFDMLQDQSRAAADEMRANRPRWPRRAPVLEGLHSAAMKLTLHGQTDTPAFLQWSDEEAIAEDWRQVDEDLAEATEQSIEQQNQGGNDE